MLAIRTATVLMLAGLLTACEDSTGPGALDLRLAASAFNSLERSRMSAGDGDGATRPVLQRWPCAPASDRRVCASPRQVAAGRCW